MKKISFVSLVCVIILAFYAYHATWFVRHNDLNLHSDVARDFLLLEELQIKKIVLIGPRTGTSGIFHGPLWSYVNFPAYFLGNGDPILVGWFWIFLTGAFIASGFYVAKKISGTTTAFIYATLLLGNMVRFTGELSHYHGALFVCPLFVYTMYKYLAERKLIYLLFHFVLAGFMIQFQMAAGIPLTFISGLIVLFTCWQDKKILPLFTTLIVPLLLVNYFLFELKHDFFITKSIFIYTSPNTNAGTFDYFSLFRLRFDDLLNFQLGPTLTAQMKELVLIVVAVLTFQQIKERTKLSLFSALLPIYFLGYIVLSFINKGLIQFQQILPLMAITNLWFVHVVVHSKQKAAYAVLAVVMLFQIAFANDYINMIKTTFSGQSQYSWAFYKNLATQIASTDKTFGYFVYSPDVFAYPARFSLKQAFKELGVNAKEYTKLPTTYIFASPPAPGRPDLSLPWWVGHQVGITATPSSVLSFANQYQAQKYELSTTEQTKPFNELINVGIHFR